MVEAETKAKSRVRGQAGDARGRKDARGQERERYEMVRVKELLLKERVEVAFKVHRRKSK